MPAGAWVAFSWAYRMAAVARSGYTSTPIHRAPMLPVPPRHRYHLEAPGSPGLVALTTSGMLSEADMVLAAIIGPKSMYRHIPPLGVRYSGTCDGLGLGAGTADGVAPGGVVRRWATGDGTGPGDRLGTSTTGTTGGAPPGGGRGGGPPGGGGGGVGDPEIQPLGPPPSTARTAGRPHPPGQRPSPLPRLQPPP